jgi:hypothetical protein
MVGYLSKKPKLSFVDDPGKLYRQSSEIPELVLSHASQNFGRLLTPGMENGECGG